MAEIDSQAETYFQAMNFHFLYDQQRQLFRIGYNVSAAVADNNFYDLLASEARIASLVALAKHEVPRSHWLHLGRPLTQIHGTRALLSWSATMFEYLMPTLLMRSYPGTLLHESVAAAVDTQIAYGREKGIPWGISESGYYAFDPNMNYQYRAFGVPGLGFKRNLAEDLVIAPYASLLALPFQPQAVAANLDWFAALGAVGPYGLYEAIDFTPARLPAGQEHALVQEYMAHHQGMILVALDNFLAQPPAQAGHPASAGPPALAGHSAQAGRLAAQDDQPPANLMVQRFHADPRLQQCGRAAAGARPRRRAARVSSARRVGAHAPHRTSCQRHALAATCARNTGALCSLSLQQPLSPPDHFSRRRDQPLAGRRLDPLARRYNAR